VVNKLVELWGAGSWEAQPSDQLHEATLLSLDSALARHELDWRPRLSVAAALQMTVEWHKAYESGCAMDQFSMQQIEEYERLGTESAHAAGRQA